MRNDLRTPRWFLLFTCVFAACVWVAPHLAQGLAANKPSYWPAIGLYLAFAIRTPARQWPFLCLCALTGGFLANFDPDPEGALLPPALAWACNTIAVAAGASVFKRTERSLGSEGGARRVIHFMLICALLLPAINASLIALAQWGILGNEASLSHWLSYFQADGLGVLTITPVAIALIDTGNPLHERGLKAFALDLCILSAFAGTSVAVFCRSDAWDFHSYTFFVYPLLLWAAMRGRRVITGEAIMILAVVVIYGTARDEGPFAPSAGGSVGSMQFFIGISALAALLLSEAVIDKRAALGAVTAKGNELEELNRELSREVELRRAAEERASRASAAKSRFIANMSHELRTPLAAVVGIADLLADPSIANAERRSFASMIKENSLHVSALIDEALDLAKVEAGKVELSSKPVELARLLEDALGPFKLKAKEKGLAFHLRIDASVPARVNTDPMRLRQILLNLVSNAMKFTHVGSIEIRASAAFPQAKDCDLLVEVHDTGIGMSVEESERIFEAFVQAHSGISQAYGGTGLGLLLSRNLARLMGGDLELVRSTKGAGSTFRLRVRTSACAEQIPLPGFASEPLLPPKVPPHALRGLRVLLAEDAPENRMIVSRLLEAAGASIDCVEDGALAVAQAMSKDYDVVLLDVQMPELDGMEAAQKLRQQGYTRPLVAISGRSLADDVQRILSAGFNQHVGKPLDRQRLVTVLRALCPA